MCFRPISSHLRVVLRKCLGHSFTRYGRRSARGFDAYSCQDSYKATRINACCD